MRILLNGALGKMGKMVTEKADGQVAAFVDPFYGKDDDIHFTNIKNCNIECDIVVDYTNHSATAELLEYCVEKGLPVIIATTGHTDEERQLIKAAAEKIPVFFSANMSIGIAVLSDLAKATAKMFPDAEIEIVETHHDQKVDVPSGTALLLANSIKEARTDAVYNIGRHENGKRTKEEIGIHSLRLGNVVGTHEILISTGTETITLKHEAFSRALFADGTIRAIEFMEGKQPGLYTMADTLR